MRTTEIRLYGNLGKRFGRRWRLHINKPSEAITAISNRFPEFKQAILDMKDCDFGVTVGDEQIGGDRLAFPNVGKTITITPVIRGSDDSKGWIQIIAGVVLIVAGILLISTPFGTPLIMLGISLALGGVAQLLAPSPETSSDTESKTRPSYQFGTIINTIGAGECVPVLYGGPMWIGSAVVSASYENIDFTSGSNATGNTSQNTGGAGLPIESDHDGEE